MFYFFFNDTATTDIYTLSLHDALPIFRYESHFVHGRDSLVDILKERGLLSESDAVQPLIGKKSSDSDSNPRSDRKSGSAGMPRPISYAVFCLKKKKNNKKKLCK